MYITTCFGCRGKFTRAAGNGIPVPPMDLVRRCNETQSYYGKDGILYEKEKSNTYCHPNSSCIRQKHPEFLPQDIEIEEAVRSTLLPVNFELFQSVFNLQLMN